MFNFDIRVSSKSTDEKLILNPPLFFYIMFLIISIMIIGSILVTSVSISTVVLLIISICALTYKEKWVLNKEVQKIVITTGVLLVYKKNIYNFDQIEEIEKKEFIKGQTETNKKRSRFSKKLFSLKIYFSDGNSKVITIVNEIDQYKLDNIKDEIKRIIN
ncbi:MAG: hypothetical protein OCD02_09830 [Spirochaetaceae bacterium]